MPPPADPFAERRAHPRAPASGTVKVVVSSGHVLEATVVDTSLRGMRLRLADAAALPNAVTVFSLAGSAAYQARVAWRTAPYAGLAIERTVDMRAVPRPQDAALHRLWREHMLR